MKSKLKRFSLQHQNSNVEYIDAHDFRFEPGKHGLDVEFVIDGDVVAVFSGVRGVSATNQPTDDVTVLNAQIGRLRVMVETSLRAFAGAAEEAQNVPFGARDTRLKLLHQHAENNHCSLTHHYAKFNEEFGTHEEQKEADAKK